MGIFFKDPILGRIEDALWEQARTEAQQRLDDGEFKPGKLKKQAKMLFKGIWSEERAKAKIALKVYKQLAPEKTREALIATLAASQKTWYSIEQESAGGSPEIMAVPLDVLSSHVSHVLDSLLEERIEFKNLRKEARYAFAQHATQSFIGSILKDSIREQAVFESSASYPFELQIVGLIKQDYYYLGDRDDVSRVDTVIASTKGLEQWKSMLDDVNARPQDRRFTSQARACWSGT